MHVQLQSVLGIGLGHVHWNWLALHGAMHGYEYLILYMHVSVYDIVFVHIYTGACSLPDLQQLALVMFSFPSTSTTAPLVYWWWHPNL